MCGEIVHLTQQAPVGNLVTLIEMSQEWGAVQYQLHDLLLLVLPFWRASFCGVMWQLSFT
jgi:hypothetical protein